MAFLNKGLTIVVRDERGGDHEAREVTYHYAGGIADFVRHLNATKSPIHKSVVYFEAEDKELRLSAEVALQWNESYSESVYTFANTINTHEGGTHEEGFRAALTSVVNRWATEKKIFKPNEDKLTGDDIREGLAAIISIKLGRAAVRGPDQDQARQLRGEVVRPEGLQRVAGRLVRAQPHRGPADHHQGDPGRPGPQGRAAGPQAGPQERPRHHGPARQARRLPLHRPGQERALHRRG